MKNTKPIPVQWPESLWRHTALPADSHPALSESKQVDVTIIGAGFTGLRAALHLAEAGTNVVVLDAGDVGYGASGRNGGQVNPMLPLNTPAKLKKILGPTYFERLTEASLNSADELFALIERHQMDCQARQHGWLRVCHNPRALKDAKEGVAEWNEFGAGMRVVEGEELKSISGTQAYQSGVITPQGGAVQPMRLAQGLAMAAERNGVSIHGDSAVLSLEKQNEHWIARTQHGEIRSDQVIIATNGYSDDLMPKLATSVIPLTPIQIATDPLPPEVIDSILPQGHTISDSRRVIMYSRREPDNRMVYGGLGKTLRSGELVGFDWLVNDAERVFPQLKGVKWSFRWGGRIAITNDHLPHLHEPQKGLIAGLGYNGRGVAMSNVMGRVMAERAMGAAADALPFPVSSIKPIPFRSVQLAGIDTVVGFMRFMDCVETRK